MTELGGSFNAGAIFNTDSNGNFIQVVHSFVKDDGKAPQSGLTEYTNGKLYGMASSGGVNNCGVIYSYDLSSNTYHVEVNFDSLTGYRCINPLILCSDGLIYGTTFQGGVNRIGTLFRFDPTTSVLTKLVDFDTTGFAPNKLVEVNGILFGTCANGGLYNSGTIFMYDIQTSSFNKLFDFDNVNNGQYPLNGMVYANGKLYGTTVTGGAFVKGVLFEFDPITNTFSKKIDLNASGLSNPTRELMVASNGKIYGVSASNVGLIFEYNPLNDSLNILFNNFPIFTYPNGPLCEISPGIFVGMTSSSGSADGAIYQFDLNTNSYSVISNFNKMNGSQPAGCNFSKTSSGKFIGTATKGGQFQGGVIIELDTIAQTASTLYDFDNTPNGSHPVSSFILGGDNYLYSMTSRGGMSDSGVIFRINPLTNNYEVVHHFDGVNGSVPHGSLLLATNMKMYGMTTYGGAVDRGVIFEFNPGTFAFNRLFDFGFNTNGFCPYGNLAEYNGSLYGMTTSGGLNGYGVIFKYDILADTLIKLVDFGGSNMGRIPYGNLLLASNQKFYGLTAQGSPSSCGVLFEFDPATLVYSELHEVLVSTTGCTVGEGLVEVNGILYGATASGSNGGVVFKYDIATDSMNWLATFVDTVTGNGSACTLAHASNGKFYGTNPFGALNSAGDVYEFDAVTDTIIKKFDLASHQLKQSNSDLIEIDLGILSTRPIDSKPLFTIFPNPSSGKIILQSAITTLGEIQIFDIAGKNILEYQVSSFPVTIDIGNLTQGIYILKLIADSNFQAARLIKN